MKLWKLILRTCLVSAGLMIIGTPQEVIATRIVQSQDRRTEQWNEIYQIVRKRISDDHLLSARETIIREDQLTYWVSEAIFNATQAQKKHFSPEKIQRTTHRAFNQLLSSIKYVITTPGLSSAEIATRFKNALEDLFIS